MSTAWESLANEPILDIRPYQPGKPVEELERELGIARAVKLASNESPFPPLDKVELPNAALIYEKLLKLGVIVRPLARFGLERALRITVGTAEENARLVESLRTVLAQEDARG